MERRMIDHIHSANRDRRVELERFRKELMGTLQMIAQPGPKIIHSSARDGMSNHSIKTLSTSSSSSTTPINGTKKSQSGDLPRMIDAARLKADAPIAGDMDEARLAQVLRGAMEDVLDSRMVTKKGDSSSEMVSSSLDLCSSSHEKTLRQLVDEILYARLGGPDEFTEMRRRIERLGNTVLHSTSLI